MAVLREWYLPSAGPARLEVHAFRAFEHDDRESPELDRLLWQGLRGDDVDLRRIMFEAAVLLGARTLSFERPLLPNDGMLTLVEHTLRQAARDGRLRVLEAPRPAVDLRSPFSPPPPPPPEVEPDPPAATWFELRIVDEVGDPIPDIDVSFEILGDVRNARTDGDGVARIDDLDGGTALVVVDDTTQLRNSLAPRWAESRTPDVPESTEDAPVEVERLDDHFDPIRVRRRLRTTLVILPRFTCREVPATTFDFARSFVRREGIPSLAAVAQELRQDDGQLGWIFAHTDLSGGERLNKRLSERRARAIWAVLTHDFDTWDDVWNARISESPWWERWGTFELQHMLNSLGCHDDADARLDEDGSVGPKTRQAIRRFKRKDYPSVPQEQGDLPDNDQVGTQFRRELFLAYAKLVSRSPVDADRIARVGEAPFMGCGEFNPLSLQARDRESRRVVVFVFDPVAKPSDPPCTLGDIAPCQARLLDPPPEEAPLYKCEFYRSIATRCPCAGGADLAHDVIVRFFMSLADANERPHKFVLEAEDSAEDDPDVHAFERALTLAADPRTVVREDDESGNDGEDDSAEDDAEDDDDEGDDEGGEVTEPEADPGPMVELAFTFVPDAHAYRLRVEDADPTHTVFTGVPFHRISELSAPQGQQRFPRLWAIRNRPAEDEAGADEAGENA